MAAFAMSRLLIDYKFKLVLTFGASFMVGWVLLAGPIGHACPMELPRIEATVKGQRLVLAVAATPETRQCGLSRRDHLPENEGMLFVHPEPRPLAFWMKDTRMALSIAFLDDVGRILSIEPMAPFNAGVVYRSPQPARYAVEVNQGWFAGHGVAAGDLIQLALPQGLRIE
jgi:hypothetical protein